MTAPTRTCCTIALACLLGSTLPVQALASQPLVVANLSLPETVWPAEREAVVSVLTQAQPSVIVVQDVSSSGKAGPAVCALARELRMHCDFVSADPPRLPLRRGTVLMSALPLRDDGASLLHGGARAQPVAAGYLAIDLPAHRLAVYSASLAPGSEQIGTRVRQAADLRRWLASHPPAQITLVFARFASTPGQLRLLMPGFATTRSGNGDNAAHGLDVLYRPTQARWLATTTLALEPPPPVTQAAGMQGSGPTRLPASAGTLLGVMVELALPDPPLP